MAQLSKKYTLLGFAFFPADFSKLCFPGRVFHLFSLSKQTDIQSFPDSCDTGGSRERSLAVQVVEAAPGGPDRLFSGNVGCVADGDCFAAVPSTPSASCGPVLEHPGSLPSSLASTPLGSPLAVAEGSSCKDKEIRDTPLLTLDEMLLSDKRIDARAALARRYRYQATAAALLRHRTALQGCHRWVAYGKDEVQLLSYPTLAKGKVKGLQSCSSPHICPVCAPKIAERRVKFDLEPGLACAREKGYGILVLTSTMRHTKKDDFEANLTGLLAARKFSRSGASMTRLRKKYGILGTIRAFESTYGVNGFHCHFHELMIFDHVLTLEETAEFELVMKVRWQESIERAGLASVTLEHGLHLSDTHKAIEEYIQKQLRSGTPKEEVKRPRWDLPQEMAKQPVKSGRSQYVAGEKVKGYSMFELLAIAAEQGFVPAPPGAPTPDQAAHIFRQFDAVVTKHRVRQLYWTPGLKAKLGVKDLSDQQIEALNEEDKQAEVYAVMRPAEISCLIADDKLAEVTSLLAEADRPGVLACIAPYLAPLATEKMEEDPFWSQSDTKVLSQISPKTGEAKVVAASRFVAVPCDAVPRSLRLRFSVIDQSADERDKPSSLAAWVDRHLGAAAPSDSLLTDPDALHAWPNLTAKDARNLRDNHAWSKQGDPFADTVPMLDYIEARDQAATKARELEQDAVRDMLAAVYLAGGGKGRKVGGWYNLPGREDYNPLESIASTVTFEHPGRGAVLRLLSYVLALAPGLTWEEAPDVEKPALQAILEV